MTRPVMVHFFAAMPVVSQWGRLEDMSDFASDLADSASDSGLGIRLGLVIVALLKRPTAAGFGATDLVL